MTDWLTSLGTVIGFSAFGMAGYLAGRRRPVPSPATPAPPAVDTSRSLQNQQRVLEQIASGAPLPVVLEAIVALVEAQYPGSLCSILLLDRATGRLRTGGGLTLPAAYSAAIDGIAIGPEVGSCGTAAWHGRTVIVSDIATDPLWVNFRELALSHGLRSCWSVPFFESRGPEAPERPESVLGTFALYRRDVGAPAPGSAEALAAAAHLAGVAVEREQATEALRAGEQRYRNFVDHATDAFFLHAEDGIVVDVNHQACIGLGYTREELIGSQPTLFDSAITRDQLTELRAILARGETHGFQSRHRRKDGTEFPVDIRIRPFYSNGVRFNVALAQDISDRVRLEEQIREAQKMEAIAVLAGGVAHDFNNLLTVINGTVDLLLADGATPPALKEEFDTIREAGDRAARLTGQLLAFSRRALVEPRVLDPNRAIMSLHTMLASLVGENITLVTDLSPMVRSIRIDPGQLEQVLMNLAVNARDAMPRGGTLTFTTRPVTFGPGDAPPDCAPGPYVCIAVADTGAGMTPEVKARIFEPFYTTKGLGSGTGLGLATVFGVVKQAGGHITVDSAPGLGTTFGIHLPAVAESPVMAPVPDPAPIPRGHETILIVEDEAPVRDLACRILERQGYRVLHAASGATARAVAAAHPGVIDLVVTDVIMPDVGGRDLVDAIKLERPAIKALFMSGYTDDAVLRQGVSNARDAFLQKPFPAPVLARKVRAVLDT